MAKNYRIYISDVLMPVTPESIETSIKGQNETVNLVDSTEYNPRESTPSSLSLSRNNTIWISSKN